MKLLICSRNPVTKELGAPKVLIELAEAMRRELGCACTVIGPGDVAPPDDVNALGHEGYSQSLRRYLRQHAGSFDVVDFDHEDLPFPRAEFSKDTLLVARSVLLLQFLEVIRLPKRQTLRSMAGAMIYRRKRRRRIQQRVAAAIRTVEMADLINVANGQDRLELTRRGVSAEKIVVIPYGISAARRRLFDAISPELPDKPVVAFVGTFDFRKGAVDFPDIVRRISEAVPAVRFRLMGTAGLFPTKEAVLSFFPACLRNTLEVIPRYASDELPKLLADCSVGMFPSYYEGFGFGVLEMMAAAVPVFAYDAPGPPMMLGPQHLLPPGDRAGMADRIIAILRQPAALRLLRAEAQDASRAFAWPAIGKVTLDAYAKALHALRGS